MENKIPFTKPIVFEDHAEFLQKSLSSRSLCAGGPLSLECESLLDRIYGTKVFVTKSCSHALEMAAILLDLQPGDEVIVPSFTFVSTANAFALRGCKIRFADNDEYGNILLSEVERLATPKTKAVVAVHYNGVSADMDALKEICDSKGIALVEDAAQSIGAQFRGKPLGTFGKLGCLSFHETKNISAGEGGALIINDKALLDRAYYIRDKGTNRRQFLLGLADKYTWVDVGSAYGMSDLNAAYLYPQLTRLAQVTERRKQIWDRYLRELGPALDAFSARVLMLPPDVTPNYHIFGILWESQEIREEFILFMASEGITAPFHYIPLHSSPFGKAHHPTTDRLAGADWISSRLTRLPLFHELSDESQTRVIDLTLRFMANN